VGVELSPIACKGFFDDANLQFKETTQPGFTCYESERITIWCGDFFKLPQNVWDSVSGIYDRAALVALPKEMRVKYASEIAKRSPNALGILLISFAYPEGSMEGPPFSVPDQEIHDLFESFDIQKLTSAREEKGYKDHPKLGSIELTESVYWLQKN
jgi:thiopurine S-methyltransferase